MNHGAITRAMHLRLTLVLTVLVTLAGAALSWWLAPLPPMPSSTGFVVGWGSPLSLPPWVSVLTALGLNGLIVALNLHLNKTYNLLRAMTRLHLVFFLLLQLATPLVLLVPSPGLVLALVVMASLALMFMVYDSGHLDARRVFLVFCLLSACASFDYAYVLYIPVFVLMCAQFRMLSLRCVLAVLMGLATPWIIMLGFGLVAVDHLQWPSLMPALPGVGTSASVMTEGTVVLTACLAIGAWLQNVVKIITYVARWRTLLSALTLVTLVTVVGAVADINHVYSYLVLLNCCAAFQLTHMFVAIHNFEKSYIGVLGVAAVYLLIYTWNMIALT